MTQFGRELRAPCGRIQWGGTLEGALRSGARGEGGDEDGQCVRRAGLQSNRKRAHLMAALRQNRSLPLGCQGLTFFQRNRWKL
jgi:hypothetical protein